jgi:hypothetical protein
MITRALPIAFGLMLAGCASGVPVERQVVVPGDRFDSVRGEAALFVRTYVEAAGERRELAGARCDVVTSLYRTELVSPSRLVVPNFGPQSPELGITCRAGERSGSETVRILTRWNEPPRYWGYPPGYWGWPGVFPPGPFDWGWYGPGYPVSDYPNARVLLR